MRFLIVVLLVLLLALGGIGYFLGGEQSVSQLEVPVDTADDEEVGQQ